MSQTILLGATIGVLGSGQLGRMFTIAARRLGYRVHAFSPDDDTPTGQVADVEIQSSYDDLDAVAEFARRVDVVTFEFENVPVETIDVVDRFTPPFTRPVTCCMRHNTDCERRRFSAPLGFRSPHFKPSVRLKS
jgi:phosphoribosylaminoimidazole carboxylase (NCAIR synthetase)